jgi:hypothetical protein
MTRHNGADQDFVEIIYMCVSAFYEHVFLEKQSADTHYNCNRDYRKKIALRLWSAGRDTAVDYK